ncbi:putative wall-associated receptor kinase-like 16 [Corylus avellana]|uniref:putative wall-associated receptor kinase-like 16 n=1 Tax=Corylus avellana TaxID=13451 RepID=UPI001E20A849|nr:putative wall-associated receptor kinase-like 16 [Corylus avellana]XP_059455152.1 putative wall-associated receptor kinase-like 16 [Corylus avellana]
MGMHGILVQQQRLLEAIILAALAASASAAEPTNSSCIRTCGSLQIPYPFGTTEGCYLDPAFLITCHDSTPFLRRGHIKVLNISLDGELRVTTPIGHDCPNNETTSSYNYELSLLTFSVSYTRNKFTALGCDTYAIIRGTLEKQNFATGCISVCSKIDSVVNGSCSGIGCCQTSIPHGMKNFRVVLRSFNHHSKVGDFNPCSFGFIAEEKAYNFSSLDLINFQNRKTLPLVLDWAVGKETCPDAQKNSTTYACNAEHSECENSPNGPGYRCICRSGYEGNPYLSNDCKDINECEISNPCNTTCTNIPGSFKCDCPKGYEGDGMKNGTGCRLIVTRYRSIPLLLGIGIGFLVLLVGASWIYWGLKRRKLIKLKEKFFKQNGGLMLQQQLSNFEGSVEPAKIFSTKELKKATNNYDESKILGQGGNGIVFKGVLPGNKAVAIKKSKVFDRSQTKQFINEVCLLTQINHRNVVKLLGCCLETRVPILVYEFITNGTLFEHIHYKSHLFSLSWENRMKIAVESAGALAYLHSEASMPIIHRDVKTANILLDDNLTAKVADFGASRLISLDETQVNTLVQGTFGYLDPEYFHSGQLTEKSDVYSFGVVVAELLTGRRAILSDKTEGERNLAMYFVSSVIEDRLLQILDNHIVNEGNIEELKEVANLAKKCLSVRGEDRPSMKEVAMELEGLRNMKKNPQEKVDLKTEETKYVVTNSTQSFSIDAGTSNSSTVTTTVAYDGTIKGR